MEIVLCAEVACSCRHEFSLAGPIYSVDRDYDSRSALVEMKRCWPLAYFRRTLALARS